MTETGSDFETFMRLGVQQHMHQRYLDSLSLRFMAYEAADNPIDSGRAARDVSASFDRLGNTDLEDNRQSMEGVSNQLLAEAYAEYALREHDNFLPRLSILRPNDAIDIESLMSADSKLYEHTLTGSREFTVSAMYVAILEARHGSGESALDIIRKATAVSWALSQRYGQHHQYDVNLMGRAAGIEGMFGSKPNRIGASKAKVAIDLARISETEKVIGFNESLNEEEVNQAQRKAVWRARAAKGIVTLAQLPTRSITRPIARKVLNKVVL